MTNNPSSRVPNEYPSDDEIPDDPVNVDDIDPFTVNCENFENIDEFSAAEWKEQSTADERIQTVINRTTTLKSVSQISEIALVSEEETKKILEKLSEENMVRSQKTDSGILYKRIQS